MSSATKEVGVYPTRTPSRRQRRGGRAPTIVCVVYIEPHRPVVVSPCKFSKEICCMITVINLRALTYPRGYHCDGSGRPANEYFRASSRALLFRRAFRTA